MVYFLYTIHCMFPFQYQNIFGVDISDASIEIFGLKKSGFGKPGLFAYNRMMLPYGVVRDGNILRTDMASEALRHLLETAKPHPIQKGWCIVALPDSRLLTVFLHLPLSIKGRDLRQAVLYELETSYPVRPSEHYWDFLVIGKDSSFLHIFAAAVSKDIVHSYIEVVRSAGLMPLAFDIESLSIGRALLLPQDRKKTVLIADIGARYTNFSLFTNGVISHLSFIPRGGDSMNENIMKTHNVLYHEAEHMKRKCNIYSRECGKSLRESIENELYQILREVKRIIQFHLYSKKRDVDTVVLAGGGALLCGIRKYFQANVRQNVEIRNPLKNIIVSASDRKSKRFIFFSNVVGLALRGLAPNPLHSGINILHKEKARLVV